MEEFYGVIEDNTSTTSPSIGSPYQNQIQSDCDCGNALYNVEKKGR